MSEVKDREWLCRGGNTPLERGQCSAFLICSNCLISWTGNKRLFKNYSVDLLVVSWLTGGKTSLFPSNQVSCSIVVPDFFACLCVELWLFLSGFMWCMALSTRRLCWHHEELCHTLTVNLWSSELQSEGLVFRLSSRTVPLWPLLTSA